MAAATSSYRVFAVSEQMEQKKNRPAKESERQIVGGQKE